MGSVVKSHNGRPASHPGRSTFTCGIGNDNPVKGVADIVGNSVNLPATRHAHHEIAALEEVDAAVEAVAHKPDFGGGDGRIVPSL